MTRWRMGRIFDDLEVEEEERPDYARRWPYAYVSIFRTGGICYAPSYYRLSPWYTLEVYLLRA